MIHSIHSSNCPVLAVLRKFNSSTSASLARDRTASAATKLILPLLLEPLQRCIHAICPSMARHGLPLRNGSALGIAFALFLILSSTNLAFASTYKSSTSSTTSVESSSSSSIDSATPLDLRGGRSSVTNVANAQSSVEQYLDSLLQDGTLSSDDFHVHGWRWHSLSFVRDAKRLERLALHLLKGDNVCEEDGITLNRAAKHVIDFNLAGLTNVENDVWLPWLRKRLCKDESIDVAATYQKQLGKIIDSVVNERDHINRLAHAVREQARTSSMHSIDNSKRREAIKNVAEMSASLATRFQTMFEQSAERILVPAVAHIVSEKDQRAVSNRVILKLGVLDSRRHLVGMYDAVLEEGSAKERALFESEMPSMVRAMIPRWRRKLYEPAAGVLDNL
jgi:hypothetical protein